MDDDIKTPPEFCQYAAGPCDQDFQTTVERRGVFLFPSQPEQIAATIAAAVDALRHDDPTGRWRTWTEFRTAGQVVFCTICKSMRYSDTIIADVTTLNFNLLFEIGFALGLELPIVPIRDTTFIRDMRVFSELGLLDTVGYVDFQNAEGLRASLMECLPAERIPAPPTELNREAPLYVLKGHIDTEGTVRLMSTLKKSALRFRTYDPLETPRLSLHEARKQVGASLAVVGHLLSAERQGAQVHNARCALVAGIAMATMKPVLLIQEGYAGEQPIDYRDVISSYRTPDQVPALLRPLILRTVSGFQSARLRALKPPQRLLERVDLGDVAAENEIRALRSYFVRTAQFNDAKRGYARLVTGRKGSGKTAVFYAVRDSIGRGHSQMALDLKPEGHQFTKFREVVLSKLTPGLQEHALTAFWNYILLCEIAQKVLDYDYSWAQRDEERRHRFARLREVYKAQVQHEEGDFSERLLGQVDRITARFTSAVEAQESGLITELLFREDIRLLDDAVGAYLAHKDEIWVLVDNLDKGWPTRGASSEDILILRTLLEATRKLERQLNARDMTFHSLLFIRNDIYDHLIVETPDRGKDTAITLDWDDPELLKEIVRQRLRLSTGLSGSFDDVWAQVFPTHVGTQDAFQYILDRTLMRPRDLLNFLHRLIEVAINRGRERVIEADVEKAEEMYSNDILLETSFEIRDVHPDVAEPLYAFLGCHAELSRDDVHSRLNESGYPAGKLDDVTKLLLWFGFLGTQERGEESPQFAYQVRYNLAKLMAPIERARGFFVVHPAFRVALGSSSEP